MSKRTKTRSSNQKSKSGSKSGYGIPNVNKRTITKKDLKSILKKPWSKITSMDIYKLYQFGHQSEELAANFKTTTTQILNRLRYQ
tara:strand:- start:693 stop:947 length:255 start_codon:yes stop_codon:yes gene_type:complete